jgi:MoaA/NifB/PqqE/SkfB family radical SAM enzyme
MSSFQIMVVVFYKTLRDYDSEKPAVIYVIAPRRSKKVALEKARIVEKRFPNVEIRILYEGKDKDEIDKVLDLCLEANRIVSPSYW